MISKLSKYVKATRGLFIFHDQGRLIEKNKWAGTSNKNLSGAWTGKSDYKNDNGEELYGHPNGVCYGLVAAYLVKGYDWQQFERFINASEGHRIILGIMNYQAQRPLSLTSARSTVEGTARYQQSIIFVEEVFNIVVKTSGSVIYQRSHNLPIVFDVRLRVKMIVDLLTVGYCYVVGLRALPSGKKVAGGHAVAFWVEKEIIKFYDPNVGEVSYLNTWSGIDTFKAALEIIFVRYYKMHNMVNVDCFTSPILTQNCSNRLATLV